jgi:regulator of cell morphogenesis and NO signaling
MNITPETQVGEIAARHPAAIRVFQRHGIDFCCGGKRPLGAACEEQRLAFTDLQRELEEAETPAPTAAEAPATAPLVDLVRRIVDGYHAGLRQELPRLSQMAAKVVDAHGARHAELAPLAAALSALRQELEGHMMKEERVLFPYIERLEGLATAGQPLDASPFGSIEAPIGMMEHEHDTAGQLLARMRELTQGYTPPADACNTFRGLYFGLGELERELHEHIHLENNVLFPRATRLEKGLCGVPAGV